MTNPYKYCYFIYHDTVLDLYYIHSSKIDREFVLKSKVYSMKKYNESKFLDIIHNKDYYLSISYITYNVLIDKDTSFFPFTSSMHINSEETLVKVIELYWYNVEREYAEKIKSYMSYLYGDIIQRNIVHKKISYVEDSTTYVDIIFYVTKISLEQYKEFDYPSNLSIIAKNKWYNHINRVTKMFHKERHIANNLVVPYREEAERFNIYYDPDVYINDYVIPFDIKINDKESKKIIDDLS